MSDDRIHLPWIEDPDAPDEVQVMTPEQSKTAANNIALMFPDLVKKDPDPPYAPPSKRVQASVWAHAIAMIDATEPEIREIIERELTDLDIRRQPIKTMKQLNRVIAQISDIRRIAIRAALDYLRDHHV